MSDTDSGDDRPQHEWKKRKKSIGDLINTGASGVAIVGGVWAFGLWVFDALPIVKASEYHMKVTQIEQRMSGAEDKTATLERGLANITVGQKETQELQLMDRVNYLDDRISKLKPDSQDFSDFRNQRNEAAQRLDRVRQELTSARGR